MINVFYGYSAVWTLVLILYKLKWSNLCRELDGGLLAFLIFSILFSFALGYIFRKKLEYKPYSKEINLKKIKYILYALILYICVEMIYERNIPVLNVVFKGVSYNERGYVGIPYIHSLVTAFMIFYSFYCSYMWVSKKQKIFLVSLIVIVLYFVVLLQRQYILICFLSFINFVYLQKKYDLKREFKNKKIKIINLGLAVAVLILLFLFGTLGNMRYGKSWSWNDSSMINAVAQKNERYPALMPNEFFWTYAYIVTPLANLNNNVIMQSNSIKTDNKNIAAFEFLSDSITKKFFNYQRKTPLLEVRSLNACTCFVGINNSLGIAGMYLMFFVQMACACIVVKVSYKRNNELLMLNVTGLLYFLMLSFFENTFVFPTTAYILLFSIIASFKFNLKKKEEQFENRISGGV